MKRRTVSEVELRDFAERHNWSTLMTKHGQEADEVFKVVRGLMASFPGRRRVRAMEIASMIDHLLEPANDDERTFYQALATNLREDYRHAFLVERAHAAVAGKPPVLLAATPRSGNTLLHRLFAELLDYPVLAAPTIDDVDVAEITSPVFMQIHAVRNRQAQRFVAELDAKVVTIARHPLDVLLSMLHFSRHEPQILDWLDGAGIPTPTTLRGASPTSDQFVDWATSKGAAKLLAISHDWWHDPDVYRLYYEDLIANTASVLSKMVAELGIDATLEGVDADETRKNTLVGLANHHRWRSKADGWRDLLPGEVAARIYTAHRKIFDDYGYSIVDANIDEETAIRNWRTYKR